MKKSWTTWFFSDPHFFHDNVIGFCNRPFKNIEEMNEKIIKNWNELVSPEDLCIFVGDIFFYKTKDEMKNFLGRMNGRKILVRGNHDKSPRDMMNSGFELCVEEMVMNISREKVLISHFPYRKSSAWFYRLKIIKNKFIKKLFKIKNMRIYVDKFFYKRPINNGQYLIHGHTHSTEKFNGKMIHVGVDAWDFKPVNIQEISQYIQNNKKIT